MTGVPSSIFAKVAREVAVIRCEAACLEALVSAGATKLGPAGLVEAQKLDHILQALDSLTCLLSDLAQGVGFDRAVASLPLAHMVDRLGETQSITHEVVTSAKPRLGDPELF